MRFAQRPFVRAAPVVVLAIGSCVGIALGQPSNCAANKRVAQTASSPAPTATASAVQPSPEQQVQLLAVFQQLLSGVESLRADAQAQIRALLTPEQQAQFETPGVQRWPTAQSIQTNGPAATSGAAGDSVGSGPIGTMIGHNGEPSPFSGQTQQVSLTDTQHAAIHEIEGSLHATDQILGDQALLAIRAILTPSQSAVLDQLKGQQGGSVAAPVTGNQTDAAGSTNDPLQLSADQQSQAAAILSQLQLDRQALHAAARQQITAVVSVQQQAQAEAVNSTLPAASGGTSPMRGSTPIGGANDTSGIDDRSGHEQNSGARAGTPLFDSLAQMNLTAYQGSSIANILSNLHNGIDGQVQQAVTSSRGITASAQGTAPGTIVAQPTAGQ